MSQVEVRFRLKKIKIPKFVLSQQQQKVQVV